MTDKREQREKALWKELDRLAFWASLFTITLLTVAYFLIASSAPSDTQVLSIAHTFALNVIANLIPTFILFVVSYVLLRRVQNLKTSKESEEIAEEIANRVYTKLLETISAAQTNPNIPTTPSELSPEEHYSLLISLEFEITDKHFDPTSSPQSIVIEFTNRGNHVIHVNKLKFSTKDLHETALLASYRKENGGRYFILPYDVSQSDVLPGNKFTVQLQLAQTWEQSAINRLMGNLGYLKPDITYDGRETELFYSI